MTARRIEPGPGQESVWDYPRPPRLEPSTKLVRVVFNGEVVAETRRAIRVLETSHPPVYYIRARRHQDETLRTLVAIELLRVEGPGKVSHPEGRRTAGRPMSPGRIPSPLAHSSRSATTWPSTPAGSTNPPSTARSCSPNPMTSMGDGSRPRSSVPSRATPERWAGEMVANGFWHSCWAAACPTETVSQQGKPLPYGEIASDCSKHQAGIAPPEPEGIREHDVDRMRPGVVGDVVQRASGVGVVEVDRGRECLMLQGGNAGDGLDRAGRRQEVSGHALGRADGHASRSPRRARSRARWPPARRRPGFPEHGR